MKNKIYLLASALLMFSLFLTGSLFASDLDDGIESSAKQSYVYKNYLKNDNIEIESEDGVVTLTGTVADESRKTLARETFTNLDGVKSVNDQIEVEGDMPEEYSDAWLITKVKATLLFHRDASATGTDISSKNGVVTIRGEADSQAQKDLTTEYAKDVEGVKDVINEMTLLTAPMNSGEKTTDKKMDYTMESVDDASITAMVKATLLNHQSTGAINATIETNEGVVTMGGKATNAAEKALATKLANDVYGVKSVVNNMTVEKLATN